MCIRNYFLIFWIINQQAKIVLPVLIAANQLKNLKFFFMKLIAYVSIQSVKDVGNFIIKIILDAHEEDYHKKEKCQFCFLDLDDLSKHKCSKTPKKCLYCDILQIQLFNMRINVVAGLKNEIFAKIIL
ncbi:unnamed protein product [Paramecium sonneborni]|uniref:Uncharacterized protein n=1 Tax=Paramecium sonneborni TaxID=65129 RepID=A0A8S1MM41_9CILI|nr:unnamed protein product [Paramecium sonneborni]